jgi:hypothetical protein
MCRGSHVSLNRVGYRKLDNRRHVRNKIVMHVS